MPALVVLSMDQAAAENVDTKEELEWGLKMLSQRKEFIESGEQQRPEPSNRGGRSRSSKKAKSLDKVLALNGLARGRLSSPTESQVSGSSLMFRAEDGLDGRAHDLRK